MCREHPVQLRSRDFAILVALRRRESAQQDGEAPLGRRELSEIELGGKAQRIVMQLDGPRRRARRRGGRETHELLEKLAVRDAELVGVGWLVAHGRTLAWTLR